MDPITMQTVAVEALIAACKGQPSEDSVTAARCLYGIAQTLTSIGIDAKVKALAAALEAVSMAEGTEALQQALNDVRGTGQALITAVRLGGYDASA